MPIVSNPTGSHGGNPRLARIGSGPCPPAFGRIGKALVALALTGVAVLGTNHHRRALELARKVGDPYWLARAREGLGVALCP
ncbi:hypothetical protein AB0L41_38830, partial [Amycolatopsis mediterranei]|uniref:hypothetical protein n=1 Tax=Amycolatopsis mediterranei TaxID=33910 RepID=UPI00341BA72C